MEIFKKIWRRLFIMPIVVRVNENILSALKKSEENISSALKKPEENIKKSSNISVYSAHSKYLDILNLLKYIDTWDECDLIITDEYC